MALKFSNSASSRSMEIRAQMPFPRQCFVIFAMSAVASSFPVHADDSCDLNRVRIGFKQLASATDPSTEWIEAHVLDAQVDVSQTVRTDETVASIQFSRHLESSVMEAPRNFTFRSGWLLNTQFEFRQGEKLRIKGRYDVAPGTSLYALTPPGESHLTIFVRPDGTLCNKVMNTNAGDHGFLVRQYVSEPKTKLRMITGETRGEPLMLRIVYLGTSGGISSLREIWSSGGRIIDSKDHTFDPSTSEIRIGPVTLENVVISLNKITTTIAAPPERIPVNSYWIAKFDR